MNASNKSTTGIIYKTTNLINGKIYVGQTIRDDKYYIGSGTLINFAKNKYGLSSFEKEIIDYAENLNELNEKETYWITTLSATNRNIGYNILSGGNGKGNHSKNWKEEASKKAKIREDSYTKHQREKINKKRLKTVNEWPEEKRTEVYNKISFGIKNAWNKYSKERKAELCKLKSEVRKREEINKINYIRIFDNEGNIITTCKNMFFFKRFCEENNLPLSALIRSYKNNGKRIYNTKNSISVVKKENHKFKGWYVKKINESDL